MQRPAGRGSNGNHAQAHGMGRVDDAAGSNFLDARHLYRLPDIEPMSGSFLDHAEPRIGLGGLAPSCARPGPFYRVGSKGTTMPYNRKIILLMHILFPFIISACAGSPTASQAVGGLDNITNAFEFGAVPGRVVEIRGAAAPIRLGGSYLRNDGTLCRDFEVLLAPPVPGLACRTGNPGWRVVPPDLAG